jgi:hypothetical protein
MLLSNGGIPRQESEQNLTAISTHARSLCLPTISHSMKRILQRRENCIPTNKARDAKKDWIKEKQDMWKYAKPIFNAFSPPFQGLTAREPNYPLAKITYAEVYGEWRAFKSKKSTHSANTSALLLRKTAAAIHTHRCGSI